MISIICPSRKRPNNILKFVSSIQNTSKNTEIIFRLDEDDLEAAKLLEDGNIDGFFEPSNVQIEQDFAIGAIKFPRLICKPIATQFMPNGTIALFEFESFEGEITIVSEKHYRLVLPNELSDKEIEMYKTRTG